MSEPAEQSSQDRPGGALGAMSAATATRLEYSIIGLGLFALVLIFQPFSLLLFGVGCGLVVAAGLINNLLPLCQPGVPLRSVILAAVVVCLIFSIMLLISIAAAYFYGVLFVTSTTPDTSTPFYQQPFVWTIAAIAVLLSGLVAAMSRRSALDA